VEKRETRRSTGAAPVRLPRRKTAQLSLFDPVEKEVRKLLQDVDPNAITPIEALKLLNDLKKILS